MTSVGIIELYDFRALDDFQIPQVDAEGWCRMAVDEWTAVGGRRYLQVYWDPAVDTRPAALCEVDAWLGKR